MHQNTSLHSTLNWLLPANLNDEFSLEHLISTLVLSIFLNNNKHKSPISENYNKNLLDLQLRHTKFSTEAAFAFTLLMTFTFNKDYSSTTSVWRFGHDYDFCVPPTSSPISWHQNACVRNHGGSPRTVRVFCVAANTYSHISSC